MKPGCSSACVKTIQYDSVNRDTAGSHIAEVKLSLTSHISIRIDSRLDAISEKHNVHLGGRLAQCAQLLQGYSIWRCLVGSFEGGPPALLEVKPRAVGLARTIDFERMSFED